MVRLKALEKLGNLIDRKCPVCKEIVGFYEHGTVYHLCVQKDIGDLPCKLDRALNIADNHLLFDIDITVDAGTSTIWATREAVKSDSCLADVSICYNFDDTVFIDTNDLSNIDGNTIISPLQDGWEVIYNQWANFAKSANDPSNPGRLHVQDPLRQIFVNGADFRVVQRQK